MICEKNVYRYRILESNFSKKYNELVIETGKTYFLLGENGVGKTTLLNSISRDAGGQHNLKRLKTVITQKVLKSDIKWMLKNEYDSSDKILSNLEKEFKEFDIEIDLSTNQILTNNLENFLEPFILRLIAKSQQQIESLEKEILIKVQATLSEIDKIKNITLTELNLTKKISEIDRSLLEKSLSLKNKLEVIQVLKNEIVLEKILKSRHLDLREYQTREFDDLTNLTLPFKKEINNILYEKDELIRLINIKNDGLASNQSFYWSVLHYFSSPFVSRYYDYYDHERDLKDISDPYILEKLMKVFKFKMKEDASPADVKQKIGVKESGEEFSTLSNSMKTFVYKIIKQTQDNFLIFDEPFNNLDYENIERSRSEIIDNGKTNIITTHNLNAIFPIPLDQIYILKYSNDGKEILTLQKLLEDGIDLPEALQKQLVLSWLSLFNRKSNLLIVEGITDYKMLKKIHDMHNIKMDFEMIVANGTYNFDFIKFIVANSFDFSRHSKCKVLYMVDNDNNGKNAIANINNENSYSLLNALKNEFPKLINLEDKIMGRKAKNTKEKNQFIDRILESGSKDQAIFENGRKIIELLKKYF